MSRYCQTRWLTLLQFYLRIWLSPSWILSIAAMLPSFNTKKWAISGNMEMAVTFSSTYYPCTPALYPTTIHCTIIEYVPYVDTNAKVTNFLPCCTIRISICQESILPYDTLFPTYLPQAYSPFERYWQTEKILHPLLHKFFFFTERAGPYPAGTTLLGWPNYGVDGRLNEAGGGDTKIDINILLFLGGGGMMARQRERQEGRHGC
jgi:hypothetical protein